MSSTAQTFNVVLTALFKIGIILSSLVSRGIGCSDVNSGQRVTQGSATVSDFAGDW